MRGYADATLSFSARLKTLKGILQIVTVHASPLSKSSPCAGRSKSLCSAASVRLIVSARSASACGIRRICGAIGRLAGISHTSWFKIWSRLSNHVWACEPQTSAGRPSRLANSGFGLHFICGAMSTRQTFCARKITDMLGWPQSTGTNRKRRCAFEIPRLSSIFHTASNSPFRDDSRHSGCPPCRHFGSARNESTSATKALRDSETIARS